MVPLAFAAGVKPLGVAGNVPFLFPFIPASTDAGGAGGLVPLIPFAAPVEADGFAGGATFDAAFALAAAFACAKLASYCSFCFLSIEIGLYLKAADT